MIVTPFTIAERFVGLREVEGNVSNPHILAMLKLDSDWPEDDAVAWCSGFVNYVCWLLRLPRSKSLLARSWLNVGRGIELDNAEPGFDVVVLKRGQGIQPGPENTTAPGHVGFFAGRSGDLIEVLGGNQSDAVNVSRYPVSRLLSVRRLTEVAW